MSVKIIKIIPLQSSHSTGVMHDESPSALISGTAVPALNCIENTSGAIEPFVSYTFTIRQGNKIVPSESGVRTLSRKRKHAQRKREPRPNEFEIVTYTSPAAREDIPAVVVGSVQSIKARDIGDGVRLVNSEGTQQKPRQYYDLDLDIYQ